MIKIYVARVVATVEGNLLYKQNARYIQGEGARASRCTVTSNGVNYRPIFLIYLFYFYKANFDSYLHDTMEEYFLSMPFRFEAAIHYRYLHITQRRV